MALADILVPLFVFTSIFGVCYLYFTTRHRERMALIEKGADASLLHPKGSAVSFLRRLIVLNIALTSMGIGLGISLAIFLFQATGEEAVYPAAIFFMAGAGLLVSYFIGKRTKEQA